MSSPQNITSKGANAHEHYTTLTLYYSIPLPAKYQKFKVDKLPLITDFRQNWTYKDLIPYYEKRYGKKILPVRRRSACDIPDDCSCPRCNAPKPFLYKNNGSKGQLLCKICAARFSPDESCFSSVKLRCPHCGKV